jgi:antitoxin HicB
VQFLVTLEPDEDGYIVAECPALPGCLSQGRTREEALVNIREAITGYLASLRKHGEPLPETPLLTDVTPSASQRFS